MEAKTVEPTVIEIKSLEIREMNCAHLDQSRIGWGILFKRINFKVCGDKLILHWQFELSVEVSILPVLKQNIKINENINEA